MGNTAKLISILLQYHQLYGYWFPCLLLLLSWVIAISNAFHARIPPGCHFCAMRTCITLYSRIESMLVSNLIQLQILILAVFLNSFFWQNTQLGRYRRCYRLCCALQLMTFRNYSITATTVSYARFRWGIVNSLWFWIPHFEGISRRFEVTMQLQMNVYCWDFSMHFALLRIQLDLHCLFAYPNVNDSLTSNTSQMVAIHSNENNYRSFHCYNYLKNLKNLHTNHHLRIPIALFWLKTTKGFNWTAVSVVLR